MYSNSDTFLMQLPKTKVLEKLERLGIDINKPSVGILLYGNRKFSQDIYSFFHNQGMQLIALSMYNEVADFNLGHELNPFEWAQIFKYFKFVVTDRFHGTIFCLKNHTKFISVEPKKLSNYKVESKIYSLLEDFDMTYNHLDIYSNNYNFHKFEEKYQYINDYWNTQNIDKHLQEMQDICMKYIYKIKRNISEN